MRMRRLATQLILALLSLTLLSAGSFAHGDKVHIRGTLTGVTANSIAVKSTDGKSVDVKLVKATVYLLRVNNADQPAKASDLAVGDMVVVHATPVGDGLEADEVRFSAPVKSPSK